MNTIALTRRLAFPWVRPGDIAAFIVGIFMLAGAVHIVTIMLVPALAQRDGWSRLAPLAATDRFAEITSEGTRETGVGGLDPLFLNGACRLAVGEEPASLVVDARDRLWTLALYDPKGTIIFSLNDRTAVGGRLDMIVVNPAQNAELQEAPTSEIDQTIVVESRSSDLVALLRLYAPTDTGRVEARKVLQAAECLPAPSVLPGR